LCTEDTYRPIIILANATQIHQEVVECVTMLDFDLPDTEELGGVFDSIATNIAVDTTRKGAAATAYDDKMRESCVQAMRGLTSREAESILRYGLRANRGFNTELINTIEDQKARTIEKSEILTYVPKERIASMDEIGGYEELKDFMSERKLAYTKEARDIGMDLPRGLVLLGVAGTGKSLVGKIISKELGLPLVVMNVAAIFGSLVGESERRVRTALATIDALDGAVVLIDEAEKALGGASENAGDSGTSRRVFGVILTWLTEKRSRTFVVLTMNKTTGIPPEFLRKGRLTR
jgi:SpoVK/Ycf46/Vps4 family AAA+-type ATPase